MATKATASPAFETRVHMGLGEAIERLMRVDSMATTGYGGKREELLAERRLIVEALNQQYKLDLGFDCNMDGIPDTIEIFMQTAQTSCCRILPMDGKKISSGRKSTRKKAASPKKPAARGTRKRKKT